MNDTEIKIVYFMLGSSVSLCLWLVILVVDEWFTEKRDKKGGYVKPSHKGTRKLRAYVPNTDENAVMEGEVEDNFS